MMMVVVNFIGLTMEDNMVKNTPSTHSLFKRLNLVLFFLLVMASLLQPLIVIKVWANEEPEAVAGQYIVGLRPECRIRRIVSRLRQRAGATVLGKFSSIGAELWQVGREDSAITLQSVDPCIEYMEPNYIIRLDKTPNDPDFDQLWGLDKISATAAWDIRTESNVIIAVIDSGVDYTHPDIAANMWVNHGEIPNNGIDDDGNGYIDDVYGYDFGDNNSEPLDDYGHGTHCAGTIAAVGNNSTGIVGVNWSAKIMALKIMDAERKLDIGNDDPKGTIGYVIPAIEYATKMGARVMSNSWGGGGRSQALSNAIQAAQEKGILFIAAAGNDKRDTEVFPHYPASYDLDNIISVAATNQYDELSIFPFCYYPCGSNYGAISVDLSAPGSDIYSTLPGGIYGSMDGTSMATPHVAGVAALLWSANPSWTYQQVRNRIFSSVDKIPSLAGKTVTGGRLNAHRALTGSQLEARIIAPITKGFAPLTVALDGTQSIGQIANYEWTYKKLNVMTVLSIDSISFQHERGERVNLVFDSAGTYLITLTITDNNGATASTSIEVVVCDDSDNSCGSILEYTVPFGSAGFYVADVILASGEEGAWGLSINTTSGMNSGGFNMGAILKENAGMPGYITFSLTESEAVSITPYEYTSQVDWLTVQVEKQDVVTNKRTTVYGRDTSPQTTLTTPPLQPGFYVVTVFSQSDSPRGISGISINANSMLGGVNIGGWLDTTGVGFGAFFVASPQDVSFTLLSGDNYGDIGVNGYLVLNIYRQYDDGSRQLYWTSN